MQLLLAVVAVLLLAVAVFAFQNPDSVTVRFLHWHLSAPVAVVVDVTGDADLLLFPDLGPATARRADRR